MTAEKILINSIITMYFEYNTVVCKRTKRVEPTRNTVLFTTFSTADSCDAYQVSAHIAVDSRFRPYLLCKDSVDLRGSLRGLGDFGDISRGFLGWKIIERIDCADCGDIVKGSMRNGHSFCVPRLWNIMIQRALGRKEGRKDCEKLAIFLQRTYYERLILYGMWHKGIASRSRRSATGKKFKVRR